MLYYGFWELSLVPMAILIAMYRQDPGWSKFVKSARRRPSADPPLRPASSSTPSFRSAPLLVAILWLYSPHRHSFDFPSPPAPRIYANAISTNQTALLWVASLAFLIAFAVKVPVFSASTAGWSDVFSEAPVAMPSWLSPASWAFTRIIRFARRPLPRPDAPPGRPAT